MGAPGTLVQVMGGAGKSGRRGVDVSGEEVIKPDTSGAKKNAKMRAALMKWGCGVPACMFTAVSALFMLDLASDLATTWGEVVKLSAIALGISVSSTALLATAGFFEDTRPDEAAAVRRAWRYGVGVLAAGAVFFVARSGPPADPVQSPRAHELRAELTRPLPPIEWEAWSASKNCETPAAHLRSTCATIRTRRAEQWAEVQRIESGTGAWSPAALINSGYLAGMSEVVRKIIIACMALITMVAGAHLMRWAVLGYVDAYREADGASAPIPATSGAISRGGPAALSSPIATADLWFQGRVIEDADGIMNPTDAFLDYERACQENGVPAMPSGQFYNWLTAKSKAFAPRVTKGKTAGAIVYRGWALGEQAMPALAGEEYAGLPYHG